MKTVATKCYAIRLKKTDKRDPMRGPDEDYR